MAVYIELNCAVKWILTHCGIELNCAQVDIVAHCGCLHRVKLLYKWTSTHIVAVYIELNYAIEVDSDTYCGCLHRVKLCYTSGH